jgi:hypothetical protein
LNLRLVGKQHHAGASLQFKAIIMHYTCAASIRPCPQSQLPEAHNTGQHATFNTQCTSSDLCTATGNLSTSIHPLQLYIPWVEREHPSASQCIPLHLLPYCMLLQAEGRALCACAAPSRGLLRKVSAAAFSSSHMLSCSSTKGGLAAAALDSPAHAVPQCHKSSLYMLCCAQQNTSTATLSSHQAPATLSSPHRLCCAG